MGVWQLRAREDAFREMLGRPEVLRNAYPQKREKEEEKLMLFEVIQESGHIYEATWLGREATDYFLDKSHPGCEK